MLKFEDFEMVNIDELLYDIKLQLVGVKDINKFMND